MNLIINLQEKSKYQSMQNMQGMEKAHQIKFRTAKALRATEACKYIEVKT